MSSRLCRFCRLVRTRKTMYFHCCSSEPRQPTRGLIDGRLEDRTPRGLLLVRADRDAPAHRPEKETPPRYSERRFSFGWTFFRHFNTCLARPTLLAGQCRSGRRGKQSCETWIADKRSPNARYAHGLKAAVAKESPNRSQAKAGEVRCLLNRDRKRSVVTDCSAGNFGTSYSHRGCSTCAAQ